MLASCAVNVLPSHRGPAQLAGPRGSSTRDNRPRGAMTEYDQPINAFMTEHVHVIDMESSLPAARKMMTEHRVRHLPVVDRSKIVGLISERDLSKLEGFPMVNLDMVAVPDAMSTTPYVVEPRTPVVEVLRKMREERLGSAIVAEDGKVVGIFTAVDAMSILINLLTR